VKYLTFVIGISEKKKSEVIIGLPINIAQQRWAAILGEKKRIFSRLYL
jgi:hypothetical protein